VYRPYNAVDMEEFRPFRGNVYQTKQRNAEGVIADKYDFVVYNVGALEADLKAYEKAAMKNFTDEEQNLVANVFNAIDAAKEEIKAKRMEEGQEQIAEAKELVMESEELIAPDVLDLFIRNVDAAPGELRYRDVTVEESLGRDNYRQADNIDYLDGDFQSSIKYSDEEFNSPDKKDEMMYGYANTSLINNRSRVYKGGGWNDRGYWLSPGTRRFLDEDKASAAIGFRCAMDRLGSQSLNGPR
jgi:hypothetical protein